MKTSTTTLIVAGLFVIAIGQSTASAGTISLDTTTPTVDGADIANLVGTEVLAGDAGTLWTDRPAQGQTFTTGSNAGGYVLNAITLQRNGNPIFFFGGGSVQVGTVSGTTLTPIATESDSSGGFPGDALDYVTMTLDTPVALAPNTLYGFDWVGTNFNGWITLNNTADPYTAGGAYSSGGGGAPNNGALVFHSDTDRVFHLDIDAVTPAPEPGTFVLAALGLLSLYMRRQGGRE